MAKDKIYYITDPLCVWCYGFAPVMEQVQQKWGKKAELVIMTGGMFADADEGSFAKVGKPIRDEYEEVARKTGVKFGPRFLKEVLPSTSVRCTSVIAAQALTVFKKQFPAQQLAFLHAIQHAIFESGLRPDDVEGIAALAVPFGADKDAFAKSMRKKKTVEETEDEFMDVADLEVEGFPTLALQRDEDLYFVFYGCADFATIDQALTEVSQSAAAEPI